MNNTYDSSLVPYKSSGDLLQDMRDINESSRESAYKAVNIVLVRRNWLLGRRIAEEELKGEARAEYGLEIIKNLSNALTREYGKGFAKSTLYNYYTFP